MVQIFINLRRMQKLLIYSLSDPRTNEIRYIGRTIQDLKHRLNNHLSGVRIKNKNGQFKSEKEKWFHELLSCNLQPIIEEIDCVECKEDEIPLIEDYWIEQFKVWGFNLTNSSLNRYDNIFINSVLSKNIYKYDLKGNYLASYNSIAEATRSLSKKLNSRSNIKRAAENNKSALGFMWSYHKVDSLIEYKFEFATEPLIAYNKEGNFVGVFKSAREASRQLKISYKHISSCAKGKRPICEGYMFRYFTNNYPLKIKPYKFKTIRSKRVFEFDLQGNFIKEWESTVLAAKAKNGNSSNITSVCSPTSKEYSYKGSIWSYDKNKIKIKI